MNDGTSSIHALLDGLGAQRSGSGWIARCPAHDDRNPSLSIHHKNGRVLLHCHAGCRQEEVFAALRERGLWPLAADRRPRMDMTNFRFLPPGIPRSWGREPSRKHYVTHWTYTSAEGRTLGHVVRYEDDHGSKDVVPFFRRRNDQWKPGAAPEPRPLYGLHQLAQKPQAPVVVAEGEKAADAAARLLPDHVATTSPGGSNAAEKADWRPLEGRNVLIWPDNDDPGRKYAVAVSRLLHEAGARSVRVIDVDALGMGPGEDAADWPPQKPLPCPLPLVSPTEVLIPSQDDKPARPFPRSPFPLEIFPPEIADSLRELAAALAAPVAPLPGAVFAVLGAALGSSVAVSPKPGWREPLIVWHGHIAESGESKTPAIAELTRPLREEQAREMERYRHRYEQWANIPQKDRKDIPEPPPARTIYASDLTLEGLRAALEHGGHGGILVAQDELSAMITGQGQYKQGRGSDREAWLSLWTGIAAHVLRTKGNVWLDKSCVCLIGGIQPRVFAVTFDPLRQTDGTLFRFLLVYEPPTHRELGPQVWSDERRGQWDTIVRRALAWSSQRDQPRVILFSDDAQKAFFDWRNDLDADKLDFSPIFRGFLPKAYAYALRLTGLIACLHAFTEGREPPRMIGPDDFERGRRAVEFYLGQTLDALTLLVDDESSPPAEVSERTLHLADTLAALRDQAHSGRLAVGHILDEYNRNCPAPLRMNSARAMGALLRSAGLTISNSRHNANGRIGIHCLVWDKATELFLTRYMSMTQFVCKQSPECPGSPDTLISCGSNGLDMEA